MIVRPSVLCPVDFSAASRGALRYAAALAEHFHGGLTVLTVDYPFLTVSAGAGLSALPVEAQTRAALATFVQKAFPERRPQVPDLRLVVETGIPATEILRVDRQCSPWLGHRRT